MTLCFFSFRFYTESTMSSSNENPENNFSVIVHKLVHLDGRNIPNFNVTSQEIYNWLLNHQDDLDSVVLLGKFNQLGNVNNKKAFELYQQAANLGHAVGTNNLGYCYQKGIGTDIDEQKAFELYHKAAN